FFFQAEDGIRDLIVTGVQTCALPIYHSLVHLFFGDERMVAPDSLESNYRMINEALISRVPIPVENVHWIIGQTAPTRLAESYEEIGRASCRERVKRTEGDA